jgi:ATP-dependent RNA helicase DHX36
MAKMVLLGTLFKCLDPILILAAIESNRSFFLSPPGATAQSDQVRYGMALGQPSDHLALLNAFREWRFIKSTRGRYAANEYAHANLMHVGGLTNIENTSVQMLNMLVEWNLAKDIPEAQRFNCELGEPELNINSDVQPLIFSLLTSGVMPNLAVQIHPILLQTSMDAKALISPNSLNGGAAAELKGTTEVLPAKGKRRARFLGAGPPGTLLMFSNKTVNMGGVFLRDTTVIGPMTALMFSGKLTPVPNSNNMLYVDDWLPLRFENGVASNILELTTCLDNVQSHSVRILTSVSQSNVVTAQGSQGARTSTSSGRWRIIF